MSKLLVCLPVLRQLKNRKKWKIRRNKREKSEEILRRINDGRNVKKDTVMVNAAQPSIVEVQQGTKRKEKIKCRKKNKD